MGMKMKADDDTAICGKRTFKFISRMTKSSEGSPYQRMETDKKEKKKKNKKGNEKKSEECFQGKENNKTSAHKEVKEKKSKKKKGWKRVRQVALTTCRYLGMGAAHLSPATMYSSPDYYYDPKVWNHSFSSSYKPKVPPQTPHWTSTMMFSQW